jgi:dolichyl-phosphate-mannose--protein O-mannosyl transferase
MSKFEAKTIPSDQLIKQIVDAYNEGLSTKQVAEKVGCTAKMLSVWKLLIHSYIKADYHNDWVFRADTYDANEEKYQKFLKDWKDETETYWKTHEGRPKSKVTSMCVARYGLSTTAELLSAWTLIRGRQELFRFLREECA